MFGDGVISSSDFSVADVPSYDPSHDSERATINTFFLQELCRGEW
jgi:hypothetical protein